MQVFVVQCVRSFCSVLNLVGMQDQKIVAVARKQFTLQGFGRIQVAAPIWIFEAIR